jgi:hypothetical protein
MDIVPDVAGIDAAFKPCGVENSRWKRLLYAESFDL